MNASDAANWGSVNISDVDLFEGLAMSQPA